MSSTRQTFSTIRKTDPFTVEIPSQNYRAGQRKLLNYDGPGWYIPSERRWESYDKHKELPRLTRRDAIDIQKESEFSALYKDVPAYKKLVAHIPSYPPYPKWNEHKRITSDSIKDITCSEKLRYPKWDNTGCYGYYQEILDRMRKGQCRLKARPGMIGYPFFTHQTYF
ncbi:unnamed protein product [Dicrocoelium dendriticum]|nr:unnamed protein product [Dicrocoelium dendriticum]